MNDLMKGLNTVYTLSSDHTTLGRSTAPGALGRWRGSCDGPVAYVNPSLAEADIANLQAAAANGAAEVFMSAASPGVIEMFMANRYYPLPRSTCSPSPGR